MSDDVEIRQGLRDLDDKEGVELSQWEASFLDSLLSGDFPLSSKQREAAVRLIEKYEDVAGLSQQTIRRLPPGTEKYFRREE